MKYFTVAHNVVHLWQGRRRVESERVSQALLGATVKALEVTDDGWAYVEGDDAYRGWAETRLLSPDIPPGPDNGEAMVSMPFADVREHPRDASDLIVRLSLGSLLPAHRLPGPDGAILSWRRVNLPGGEVGWIHGSALAALPTAAALGQTEVLAVRWATEFLGTPYLWGGSSAFGLDCSGLVQLCYRLGGIVLRRDADIQRSDPRFLPVVGDRQPGDLVFFGNKSEKKITHVGMELGGGKFIHAAGGVGVIVTTWDGDTRYAPSYIDARRLDPARASEPVTRFEAEDR